MATLDQSKVQASAPTEAGLDSPRFSIHQQQRRWGWVFLSPWIIGFLAFYLIPMAASLVFTFTDFDLNEPANTTFIGTKNWARIFNDADLSTALIVTLKYAVIVLPFSIIVPLGLASLLNAKSLWAKRLFRTLFYMPFMVPIVSVIYIFNGFLNAQSGWLNRFLTEQLGVKGPNWLYDPNYIYLALFIIGLWGTGNAMLTMLASMQTVPTELYEASKIDGANAWMRFRKITLPMISPVIFYNLVLATVGLFRYFEVPYILKQGSGDPNNATLFYNVYFYRVAFRFQEMGYGATLAWVLFFIALTVTIGLFISSRYWVYYADEGRS